MAQPYIDKLSHLDEPLGVYIHIPFCLRKCPYCDFYSTAEVALVAPFIAALSQELQGYAECDAGADTLYIGGGTPSVLKPAEIAVLLAQARRCFKILPDAEVTLEVNPGTVSAGSLLEYRRCGVNRLNIGVQSFQDRWLGFLGRIHSAADARESIEWARQAGFTNIGIDLMYGIPGQTQASWRADLEQAVSFRPEHLSCYMLTFESGTPLDRRRSRGCFRALPEKRAAKLYLLTAGFLEQNGYVQYEVSNFTRSGPDGTGRCPSRHNRKYWTFAPYLGLGPSAHSFLEPVRFWNPRSVTRYIERLRSGLPATEDHEILSPDQQMMEAVLLGLRTKEGIPMDRFRQKFKRNFLDLFGTAVSEFEKDGLMILDGGRCFLSSRGVLLLDGIVAKMVKDLPT